MCVNQVLMCCPNNTRKVLISVFNNHDLSKLQVIKGLANNRQVHSSNGQRKADLEIRVTKSVGNITTNNRIRWVLGRVAKVHINVLKVRIVCINNVHCCNFSVGFQCYNDIREACVQWKIKRQITTVRNSINYTGVRVCCWIQNRVQSWTVYRGISCHHIGGFSPRSVAGRVICSTCVAAPSQCHERCVQWADFEIWTDKIVIYI